MNTLNRREFLRDSLIVGASALFSPRLLSAGPVSGRFLVGINYPWIAYGHDYGGNRWGHDGISTGGWTHQTWRDSQGFTNVALSRKRAHSGLSSLRITTNLLGGHPNLAQGEVYVDLKNHPPRGSRAPFDLDGTEIGCWVFFPQGSSGQRDAPNGLQLFLKSGTDYQSFYSPWKNIDRSWEGRWTRHTLNTSNTSRSPGYVDAGFDPHDIVAVGIKVGINSHSTASLKKPIYIDDFFFKTKPQVRFNFEKLEVQRDFSALRGILGPCSSRLVRVFVFADGSAAPTFRSDGSIGRLSSIFVHDFDHLLRAALARGLMLIPVLLDFTWFNHPKMINGVQIGGHADIIQDANKQNTFFKNALIPFLKRYRKHPAIYAIDIINEPEWAIVETQNKSIERHLVNLNEMRDFVRQCAYLIKRIGFHRVTVGSARRLWLHHWQGLDLDLYQFHWYDHFAKEEPFPWSPYTELGLDRPCIVGEVPTANTQYSAEDYLQAAKLGGYHGLLFWSYRGGDEYSNFQVLRATLKGSCENL